MQRRRDLVPADPLDLVRRALALALRAGVLGVDRARGIARDHADGGVLLLQESPGAAHRPAGAGRAHEVRDAALRLLPDLGARSAVVHLRVHGVVVLVGEDGVVVGRGDGAAFHDVVVGVVGRDGAGRDDHLGAERAQQPRLFLGHLVGHREHAAVALHRRRDREPHPGVAARGLDDQAAGLEPPLPFGGLDHRETDAVLDRAAGVEELRLRPHRRFHARRHPVQPDQRRPADRLEDGGVRLSVRGQGRGTRCRSRAWG